MTVKLTCAGCGAPKSYTAYTQRGIIDAVRSQGGAITRDNVYYCPVCAPDRRHVGRGGANNNRGKLANVGEQLSII